MRSIKPQSSRLRAAGAVCGQLLLALALTLAAAGCGPKSKESHLLNVSFDATRELYSEFNKAFAEDWRQKTGDAITVRQSHGGSAKQARSVIEGLRGEVLSLALPYDIDMVARRAKLLPADWRAKLPANSCPYTSTIVFLVRPGNPKQIHDWADLIRPGLQVVTANPKTSGGARWAHLAAWGHALKAANGDHAEAARFMKALYANVPTLESGARAAMTTFAQRGVGDVLLAWENEAMRAVHEASGPKLELVAPPVSIKAEPPIALVERNAIRGGVLEIANAYLQFHYTPQAQELFARHYFRPSSPEVIAKQPNTFAKIELLTVEDLCGDWQRAHDEHFKDGAIFDQSFPR